VASKPRDTAGNIRRERIYRQVGNFSHRPAGPIFVNGDIPATAKHVDHFFHGMGQDFFLIV
jgi:hypothetical protein